jgi:glycosyltransferase involved in cell wall biosynthesis
MEVRFPMNPATQPLVSVVTPVYNAEKYLAQCIESVLAQTYENWEYVIVDNCSTDRSLEIAQRYAQQDSRIRVHQNGDFLSQLQNLNHTMRQISSQSEYCKVVHADDWIFAECIDRMVKVAEAYPTIGIVSAYRLAETRVTLGGLPYPSTYVPGREICRSVLRRDLRVFGSPTSLLIRSDLVRNRPKFYPESTVSADTLVCFELLQESDFGFVHQVLTFTRRHNESMTSLTHKFSTRRLGRLAALVEYGPIYLEGQEHKELLAWAVDSYYAFLARSVFELKGRDFWEYQRTELRNLGYPLRPAKLVVAALEQLLDLRTTWRRVRHAMRKRSQNVPRHNKPWTTVLSSMYKQ